MMKKTLVGFCAAATLLLQGCLSISGTKTLAVPVDPNQKTILVTSNATVQCRDYFFFFRCNLAVDVQQVK